MLLSKCVAQFYMNKKHVFNTILFIQVCKVVIFCLYRVSVALGHVPLFTME